MKKLDLSPIKDKLYVFQALVNVGIIVVAAILYFPKTFATNDRVEKLEKKVVTIDAGVIVNQNILCKMAIEQGLLSAVEICTKMEESNE